MAQFDKFYTKSSIAKQCYDFLCEKIPSVKEGYFLEPSAGDGSFLEFLPRFDAFDIRPEGENIKQADFLSLTLDRRDYITIGNPPFGKRSKLAISFFNHAAKYSKIIAFIVPVSFMKWSVQKELDHSFHLLDYFYLQEHLSIFAIYLLCLCRLMILQPIPAHEGGFHIPTLLSK